MPKKRRQARHNKTSPKKPYKRYLSQEERNTKINFLEGLVNRTLNDKVAIIHNKIAYGYYPKLIKECESDFQ